MRPITSEWIKTIKIEKHIVQKFQALRRTHRPVADVADPAVEPGVLALRHHDLCPRVVDEDGRVAAVDLVVVLRYDVVRPPDASCDERCRN